MQSDGDSEPDPVCRNCGGALSGRSWGVVCPKCALQLVLKSGSPDLSPQGVKLHTTGRDIKDALLAQMETGLRYRAEREHALGGMGRILIAQDVCLGREIIMKELLGHLEESVDGEGHSPWTRSDSKPAASRFMREARITGQLEHPSIVPVHELGIRENGNLYYTMKYVHGVSLAESLENAAGLVERLLLLPHVLNVCQAIAYAHSRGIVHRDIKPANIMVGEFGETVLLDWGLARVKGTPEEHHEGTSPIATVDTGDDGASGKTTFGQVLGTPAYMAPEQAQGRVDDVDERSDVYALGALLYTLLTGKPPFSGTGRENIIRQAAAEAPESVRVLAPMAPPELAAICERAMVRDPEQRYASAREVAEELQRFLTGGLVNVYEYRATEHLRRFVRRNKRAVLTAAVAFSILVVVAVGSYVRIVAERNRAVDARNEATQARDSAAQSQEQAEQEAYYRGIAYAHAKIQQGDFGDVPRVLEGLPERFRGWEWGYLMGQCHLEEKSVQAHQGAITAFAANQDGSILATAGEDGELIVWDGDRLEERWRWPAPVGSINALALSADGTILAAGGEGLLLVEPRSGRVIKDTFPKPCDAEQATEFALAMTVSGAPESGGTGRVRYNPVVGKFGWAEFPFHNGNQCIRLTLAKDHDPTGPDYHGLIKNYRIDLPYNAEDPEAYRAMEVRIQWIAVTNDPAFTPGSGANATESTSGLASKPLQRAVWTFETENKRWVTRGTGAVLKQSEGALVLTYDLSPKFEPAIALFPDFAPPAPTNAMEFSPDGTRLYVLADNQVRILRTSDGHEIKTLSAFPANALAISPDGRQLATGGSTNGVNHYRGINTTSFEPLWSFSESGSDTQYFVRVVGMAFDPSSQHLLCVGEGWMGVRNIASGKLERHWINYVDWLDAVESPKVLWKDENHFLVAGRDGVVTACDTLGESTNTVIQSGSKIVGIAGHADTTRITLAYQNGQLESWLPDAASRMRGAVDLASADFSWGQAPALSPDGRFLTVYNWGFDWTLWDMRTMERIKSPFTDSADFLAFRPESDQVAVLTNRGRVVRIRGLSDHTEKLEIPLTQVPGDWSVLSCTMDGSGKYMAISRRNGVMQSPILVDLSTGQTIPANWPALNGSVYMSPDGRHLAIGRTHEPRIDIWTVPDCHLEFDFRGYAVDPAWTSGVDEMVFHPGGSILATATYDGNIMVFDLESSKLIRVIKAQEFGDELSLCFSPDGKRLATGGDDGTVRIWDWRTGHELLKFQDNYLARGVGFSPDGSTLFSGGGDPPVRVRVGWPASATLLPEVQRRRTCHERLIALDNAKLAWAVANHRKPEESPKDLSDIQAYLDSPAAPVTCLAGGTYRLGAVKELPRCSVHGAPYDNPSLSKRIKTEEDEDNPLVGLFLARLCATGNAADLSNLASTWEKQHRFYRSAVMIAHRAVELAPEEKMAWRILARAELHTGRVDDAVAHFREGYEADHDPAAVGLALALITRGTEQDLAEACTTLEAQAGTAPTSYTEEALQALDKLPPSTDPSLRERTRALLEAHRAK